MLTDIPKPAIIAHRGSSAYAPENTLAAFKLAVQHGADGIELDAKLTADQQIVVMHDLTVDRTTDGHGRVSKLRMVDLQNLDAGSYFDESYKNEPIPSLEDVLKTVGGQIVINIELTNYSTPFDDLPERAARLVEQYQFEQNVFFSSFSVATLIRLKKIMPQANAGLLIPSGWRAGLTITILSKIVHCENLHPELGTASPEFIAAAHNQGYKTFFYTVNDAHAMRRLFMWGADGIFTDDPLLARKIREEMALGIV